MAHSIARSCFETITTYGRDAVESCERNLASASLEKVVGANILMSCIGFESGSVATAHAIHHGLCEFDEVHCALHGEKVTIGILAGLIMQGREVGLGDMRLFCQSVGLPTLLSGIGINAPTEAILKRVAQRACRPDEIIHNEPKPVSPDMVIAALWSLV